MWETVVTCVALASFYYLGSRLNGLEKKMERETYDEAKFELELFAREYLTRVKIIRTQISLMCALQITDPEGQGAPLTSGDELTDFSPMLEKAKSLKQRLSEDKWECLHMQVGKTITQTQEELRILRNELWDFEGEVEIEMLRFEIKYRDFIKKQRSSARI